MGCVVVSRVRVMDIHDGVYGRGGGVIVPSPRLGWCGGNVLMIEIRDCSSPRLRWWERAIVGVLGCQGRVCAVVDVLGCVFVSERGLGQTAHAYACMHGCARASRRCRGGGVVVPSRETVGQAQMGHARIPTHACMHGCNASSRCKATHAPRFSVVVNTLAPPPPVPAVPNPCPWAAAAAAIRAPLLGWRLVVVELAPRGW